MDSGFFKMQMQRLREVYGDKYFSDERVKIFWEYFNRENEKVFMQAINQVIAESIHVPTAKTIREAVYNFRSSQPERNLESGNASWEDEIKNRTPEQQASIDRARDECLAYMRSIKSVFRDLPYDASKRIEEEWDI